MNREVRRGGPRLAAAAVLAILAAGGACREAQEAFVWPPDTAALVEGQSITISELNQVLGWGLYGQLNPAEEQPAGLVSADIPRLVLEKLIEEKLVLAEAARRYFSLKEAERELSAAGLKEERSETQAEILNRNLFRQHVLHKITTRIMAEGRHLSAAEWRAFWRDWPRNKPTRYLVKVLFLPPSLDVTALPESKTLDQTAQQFQLEGFPSLLSTAVWLRSDRLDGDLQAILESAWANRRPSPPVLQEGSWAIYEVLNLDRKTAAVAEFKAARAAYEFKAGEEAFRAWLAARRSSADIRINPSLTSTQE